MRRLHPSFLTILFDDKDQSCRLDSSRMQWKISDLDYFLACCKAGSFTAAARDVHIVQSATSSAIAWLGPGSRGATVRPERHAGSPDRARATAQAGAQQVLDSVQAARDDIAAVWPTLWPDPRHSYLWNHFSHSGPLTVTSPASWQMSATAIPTLSFNCARLGPSSGAPSIARRRVNGYRHVAGAAKHVTY